MTDAKIFCEKLGSDFSAVSELWEEHLTYNDELLPHVFFGDLTRFVLAGGRDKSAIVQRLEDSLNSGATLIDELIAVSFVENIETSEELEEVLAGVRGNKLRDEWQAKHRG